MKEVVIYTAGPLGFSEAGRYFHTEVFVPMLLRRGFQVLDPWKLTDPRLIEDVLLIPEGPERRMKWGELNPIIGTNNAEAIRKSDILVAVLDGVDVDSGTASEIGFAAALGKPIVGYRGDFRLSADNSGSTVNLQVEYFIGLHGGTIVTTMDELEGELASWLNKLRRAG